MSHLTVSLRSFNQTKSIPVPKPLQPMPFWLSVCLFGIPTLVMAISFYVFRPWLQSLGISEFKSFLTAHIVPTALLLVAALVALYRVENYPVGWKALSERFRFPQLRVKDGLWALIIFLALMAGYGMASQFGKALVLSGWLPLPAHVPALIDPRTPLTLAALNQMAGGTLRGNWDVAVLYFVMLCFNIVGEELWWRGYILPRQELSHGKWTWLLHGCLWALFHAFKYWDLIGLLPVCLIISFAAQRMKNNWPAFIAHYVFNGLGIVVVLAAVLGILA
jgi:membrane protease YdiL (CAAX protease family)